MEITDVRIRRIESEGKMKAVVSVTFDNEFVVHDIKIIESQNGLFIAMPSRKTPSGEFRDIAHPIHSEARANIQSAILEKYHTMLVEEETTEATETDETETNTEQE
ncbi:MAG: septation regulator SpoVG [Clostridiaceae bacterium]|jgi:stage V sporulation protein G|nr:septation regulator SpoVG [Clostridiaceae bacterium]